MVAFAIHDGGITARFARQDFPVCQQGIETDSSQVFIVLGGTDDQLQGIAHGNLLAIYSRFDGSVCHQWGLAQEQNDCPPCRFTNTSHHPSSFPAAVAAGFAGADLVDLQAELGNPFNQALIDAVNDEYQDFMLANMALDAAELAYANALAAYEASCTNNTTAEHGQAFIIVDAKLNNSMIGNKVTFNGNNIHQEVSIGDFSEVK